MANQHPPDITLTTTISAPQTTTTTSTYTIGGRRSRGNTNPSTNNANLRPPGSNNDADTEPFPALSPLPTAQTPGPLPTPAQTTGDYFAQTPLQYQVRNRPIGIRRLPSSSDVQDVGRPRSGSGLRRRRANTGSSNEDNATAGLSGLPGHYEVGQQHGDAGGMRTIVEGEEAQPGRQNQLALPDTNDGPEKGTGAGRSGSKRLRRASNAARSMISKISDDPNEAAQRARPGNATGRDYESDVVDYLDVLDPEVSTLTTLTNVQNSLFVPDIPFFNRFYNRRPTYELTRGPSRATEEPEMQNLRPQVTRQTTARIHKPVPPTPEPPEVPPKSYQQDERILETGDSRTPEPGLTAYDSTDDLTRRLSITSHVEEDHFAVLPHGVTLEGWSQEDVDTLDDYVRHMLHSRRSRFKRSMKGFGKYVRKPLGFCVTLYAFLITMFGTVWVLFLIGWISLGVRKEYIVHIVDSVLVALFAIMGDGLAPFRAVDTYHMIFIAHYHRLSWKLRKAKSLPKLSDPNDLPERTQKEVCEEAEAGFEKESDADWEFSVLTLEQQKKLVHHQNKFSKSHSYYRPHETTTHHAFPLKLLITIVSLLDLHSCLQISLGAFTWGWSYHTRPEWITAVILSISITVNITAGVLISVGDKRTRKKDVLLRMARQGLTEEAMRKVERRKQENNEDATHVKRSVANVRHELVKTGVIEPAEKDPLKKGTKKVQEKIKGYKTDHESDSEKAESSRSRSEADGVAVQDMAKQSTGRKESAGDSDESYRTASNKL